MDAAAVLFRSKGFDATSTLEIAAEAGVSESMIFRHFGSKKALFDEAVLKPFTDFVTTFVVEWAHASGACGQPQSLAESYVGGLFELCRDHVDMLTLMSAQNIGDQVHALAEQLERHHADAGTRPILDADLSVRLAIALVVGAAHLGEDFFGVGAGLPAELGAFVVRGAGSEPPPS